MIKYYDEILNTNEIKVCLPFSNKIEDYILPNSYYINTLGILYNCLGEEGHKEANLVYTYNLIKDAFYDKEYISFFGSSVISLEEVLKKELITYKRVLNGDITKLDIKNYIHMNLDITDKMTPKLLIGIISSKIILLEKFIDLKNKSNDKVSSINRIIDKSNDDISDILVRFCGFHKIESMLFKTITTSSVDLNSFKNYLDNGFNINVISGIDDDLLYKSLVIDNFIDKNIEYKEKVLKKF